LFAKHGVSSTVTLSLPGTPYFTQENEALNSPIGFDWSHVDHRGAQNSMWARVLHMTDELIPAPSERRVERGLIGDASMTRATPRLMRPSFDLLGELPKVPEPLERQCACGEGISHGAARFTIVLAVAEATALGELRQVGKAHAQLGR
jgi:hypothetical protein